MAGDALTGQRRKTLEVVVRENENPRGPGRVPLDPQRPSVERGVARPGQPLPVAMRAAVVGVVFRRQIAKQPDVKKIGRLRQDVERPAVLLRERASVIPNPANAMLFEKMHHARQMPVAGSELDRVAETGRQPPDEIAQRRLVMADGKTRRKLEKDAAEFRAHRGDRVQKRIHFFLAVSQLRVVRDFAGHLAREAEMFRRLLQPVRHHAGGGRVIESGVHLDRVEMAGVKFQPAVVRQMGRVK